MQYKISFTNNAEKEFKKAQKSGDKGLLKALKKVVDSPKVSGKPLRDNLQGCYKKRSDPYRIIYTIDEEKYTVLIIKIGTRDDVYSDLEAPF